MNYSCKLFKIIVQSRPTAYLKRAKFLQFTIFSQGHFVFIWRAALMSLLRGLWILCIIILVQHNNWKKQKKQCKFQNISSKWKHIIVSELMTDHSLSACQIDLHVISLLSRRNNYDIKDLSLLIFHSDGTVSSNGVQTAVWRSSYGECLSVSGLLVVIRCLEDRLNSRLHQSTSAFLQLW